MPRNFNLPEVTGLRIYLALWVAAGHALQTAGFLDKTNPILALVLDNRSAVIVFMIVSGFVITNLLLVKQETYPRYITRRFFRLYPAYVLCCIIGYLVSDQWSYLVQHVPWTGAKWSAAAESIIALETSAKEHFWAHIVAHATMLHGALPNQLLNRAPQTFLPAAWSISLEWQFYLVAPLIIAALRNRWQLLAAAIVSLVLLVAYRKGMLGTYDIGSSMAGATPYFMIGIVSRLAYDRLARLPVSPLVASSIAIFVFAAFVSDPAGPLVWTVFFAYSLWHGAAPVTGPAFRALTMSRPALLLGEASYSLYLIHRPIQILLAVWALSAIPITHMTMLAVEIAAIGVAIPISIAMFLLIERPGIKLGARVARQLPGAGPPSSPQLLLV